jgi:hypothetical protein
MTLKYHDEVNVQQIVDKSPCINACKCINQLFSEFKLQNGGEAVFAKLFIISLGSRKIDNKSLLTIYMHPLQFIRGEKAQGRFRP